MAIFNSYVCLPEGLSTDFRLKLVGGIPTPLKNMSQWEGLSHIPNHQPVMYPWLDYYLLLLSASLEVKFRIYSFKRLCCTWADQRNMGFKRISVSCWMLLDVAGLKWACKKLLTPLRIPQVRCLVAELYQPKKTKVLEKFGGRCKRSSFGRSPGQSIFTRQLWHPPKFTKSWPNFLASSLILESSNR